MSPPSVPVNIGNIPNLFTNGPVNPSIPVIRLCIYCNIKFQSPAAQMDREQCNNLMPEIRYVEQCEDFVDSSLSTNMIKCMENRNSKCLFSNSLICTFVKTHNSEKRHWNCFLTTELSQTIKIPIQMINPSIIIPPNLQATTKSVHNKINHYELHK